MNPPITAFQLLIEIRKSFRDLAIEHRFNEFLKRASDDQKTAALMQWFITNDASICAAESRIRFDRQKPGQTSLAAREIVTRIKEQIKQELFDTLRLPDGRLFADVAKYEYGALKRNYRGWVAMIEAVEGHVKFNDDTATARQTLRPDVFEKFARENLFEAVTQA